MKLMQPNTESTVFDRLRIVVGVLLSLGGLATIAYLFITMQSGNTEWLIGLSLIVVGIIVSGSHRIAMFIESLTR